MAKVDTAIAAGGIGVLVVAAFGILYLQEWSGLTDVTFPTQDVPLEEQAADVGPGTTVLEWTDLPGNATGADVTVQIGFEGRAITGGSATVQLTLTAPQEDIRTRETFAFTVDPGSADASATFSVDVEWAPVPEAMRTQPSRLPPPVVWATPLVLEVTVTPPADVPVAEYAFSAQAQGSVHTYAADHPAG